MTVRRGSEWGRPAELPGAAVIATTDAEVAASLTRAPGAPVLVRGGDLHRALGAPTGTSASVRRLPIDVLRVEADGVDHVAVAHVVARRNGPLGWWSGPIVFVMNTDHLGSADVAPRAHPNDGRLDVVKVAAAMPLRARLQARRRVATGTHVPHPDIAVRQATSVQLRFERSLHLWVDGVAQGAVTALTVTVQADGAAVLA